MAIWECTNKDEKCSLCERVIKATVLYTRLINGRIICATCMWKAGHDGKGH